MLPLLVVLCTEQLHKNVLDHVSKIYLVQDRQIVLQASQPWLIFQEYGQP